MLHRGDLLGEVTRLRRTIAVAGTHGKTTTASMAAHVLVETGRDPAYLIGGEVRSTGTNAAWGAGEWLVVEADESDRSFLKLSAEVAVVTNVELDHHATFATLGELQEAFDEFTEGARVVIADVEEPGGRAAAARLAVHGAGCGVRAVGARAAQRAERARGRRSPAGRRASSRRRRRGRCARSPARAGGSSRTATGPGGSQVYDDYAHHPTEVRATLEAARTLGAERVVACFQPHLYSRTQHLARDFGKALALADVAVVLDVYPARERAEDFPGVSGWLVAAAAADAAGGRPVYWTPGLDDAERLLRAELGEGDALLTLGAGDVDALARALTDKGGWVGVAPGWAEYPTAQ